MSIHITEDEIDKKVRELRERRQAGDPAADPSRVKRPDPNKRYRWANKRRVDYWEDQNYVVTKPSKGGAGAIIGRVTEDHAYERGDLVLMETSRDNYINRVAKARYLDELRSQQGRNQARETINRLYRDEMHGKPHRDITFDESDEPDSTP